MKRISLRQIAQQAKVSAMTVSLALRDHRRIPPATRQRIKALAVEMGYQPDPALSALMAYRHERRTVREYGTLAFLTNFPSADGWKTQVYIARYYDGAMIRARELGYRIDTFWMQQPGMTPRRMAQILSARGIKGLLVAPMPAATAVLTLDWDQFCAVSLCRNLVSPYLNVVDHNHHQGMVMAWREARRRGYRRIGYAIREYAEDITGRLWLATFLMEQQRPKAARREKRVEPLVTDRWRREVFERWLKQERPDVIISPDIIISTWLEELGFNLPGDIGFIWLEAEAARPLSGVCQHFEHVGTSAVDMLHLELLRSAYGIPLFRHALGIDGSWIEGKTLRPAPEEAATARV
jgi:LacI family transcriptional regulator